MMVQETIYDIVSQVLEISEIIKICSFINFATKPKCLM